LNKNQLRSPEDDRLIKVRLETSTAVDKHGRRDADGVDLPTFLVDGQSNHGTKIGQGSFRKYRRSTPDTSQMFRHHKDHKRDRGRGNSQENL